MKIKMLINAVDAEEYRVAVVKEGHLDGYHIETSKSEDRIGNIYKGVVEGIRPSIQACFVDFGDGRDGFLSAGDIHPEYYLESDAAKRKFRPMNVKPSVAQAAMIGNPVSMPRVIHLVDRYNATAGMQKVFMVEVAEQAIMDWQLQANQNGHIACTHGGESLAGLLAAKQQGLLEKDDIAVLDSTAHALKFSVFQGMYFENKFPVEYEIKPVKAFANAPQLICPRDLELPAPGRPLQGEALKRFVERQSEEIAKILDLKKL